MCGLRIHLIKPLAWCLQILCHAIFNSPFIYLAQAAKVRELELQTTELDKLKEQYQGIYTQQWKMMNN